MKIGTKVLWAGSQWTVVEKVHGGYWIEQPARGKSIHRVYVPSASELEVVT